MPFKRSDLTVIASGNGYRLWHYRCLDVSLSFINEMTPGMYFGPAHNMLRVGDQIDFHLSDKAGRFLVKKVGCAAFPDYVLVGVLYSDWVFNDGEEE